MVILKNDDFWPFHSFIVFVRIFRRVKHFPPFWKMAQGVFAKSQRNHFSKWFHWSCRRVWSWSRVWFCYCFLCLLLSRFWWRFVAFLDLSLCVYVFLCFMSCWVTVGLVWRFGSVSVYVYVSGYVYVYVYVYVYGSVYVYGRFENWWLIVDSW